IAFDRASSDAAGVAAPATRLMVSEPRPNPAPGVVRLTVDGPAVGALSAAVYDVAGRRLRSWAVRGARQEIAGGPAGDGAAPGLYFLRVRWEGAQVTRTIIVSR